MSYNDFIDLKSLTKEIRFNSQKNTQCGQITLSDIKMIRLVKGSEAYYYKSSYKQMNWEEAHNKTTGTRRSWVKNLDSIITKLAYKSKIPIAEKKDWQSLRTSNVTPKD